MILVNDEKQAMLYTDSIADGLVEGNTLVFARITSYNVCYTKLLRFDTTLRDGEQTPGCSMNIV